MDSVTITMDTIPLIDLETYTATTHCETTEIEIEIPKEDKKQRGRVSGKIGLEGRFKLKLKEGEDRGSGKIDYRGIIGRLLGKQVVGKGVGREV